jgi:DNA polymerase
VEVECCSSYLEQQIRLVSPDVILALGRFAAHRLLETEAPVYKMRATENYLPGSNTQVIVTYHPASLLRNPEQKAQAWDDLRRVSTILRNNES